MEYNLTPYQMDTRFWGPPGWRLLHLITFTYDPEATNRQDIESLFTHLPYVLPCKFCRASLTGYMDDDPLLPSMKSRAAFSKWLWRIHNKVNDKLRGQGIPTADNPSFDTVKKIYEGRIAEGCVRTNFEGWDFLFSLADNHPLSRDAKTSVPMEGCPSSENLSLLCEKDKNRWNTMTPDERFQKYVEFWKSVGPSLPFQEWIDVWNSCKFDTESLEKRTTLVRELWRIRCCMEKNLELSNKDTFQSLCKRIRSHRSGCSKKKRARTCRKTRKV